MCGGGRVGSASITAIFSTVSTGAEETSSTATAVSIPTDVEDDIAYLDPSKKKTPNKKGIARCISTDANQATREQGRQEEEHRCVLQRFSFFTITSSPWF
jgi:hypothetical protein